MKTNKILITGATGLLGSTLLMILNEAGFKAVALKGDITKKSDLSYLMGPKHAYDYIIHTAAITNIEQCEEDKTYCHKVNAKGSRNMLELAKHFKAKFIYISTASVFSGRTGNYREQDKPSPSNYYSQTKYESEKLVVQYPLGLVLRINLIGIHPRGSRGTNFFEWLYNSYSFSRNINLYKNITINPLSNWTLAELIMILIKNDWLDDKILHLGSRDHLSKAAIGQSVKKFFPAYRGHAKLIKATQLNNQSGKIKQMWLNTDLLQKKYNLKMPSLKEEILKIFNNLKK